MQPLAGTTVLDLTRLLPGGFCTLILADLGADVLKIEEPGRGDYLRAFPPMGKTQSALFTALNRGKRSMTLNLKSEAGRALLLDLARGADVLIEGFRPGVLARLGLDYPALQAVNPRLIVCAISGYGQQGPLRARAGHDLNYLGYAGALPQFAPRGGGLPIVPGMQIADLGGGALTAAVGILAALLERTRSGQGRFLDIAMTDGVLHWLAAMAAQQWASGDLPAGGRGSLSGGYACYSVYATADSRALTVAAVEPHFWANLCRMLGRDEYAALQYAPWPEQERIFADLDALFATRALDRVAGVLRRRRGLRRPGADAGRGAGAARRPADHARPARRGAAAPAGRALRRRVGAPGAGPRRAHRRGAGGAGQERGGGGGAARGGGRLEEQRTENREQKGRRTENREAEEPSIGRSTGPRPRTEN